MARTTKRPPPTAEQTLSCVITTCPACGHYLSVGHYSHRTVTTLDGVTRYYLQVRLCRHHGCPRYHLPFRPEAEGRLALPHHEFGLDVLALVGALRYAEHRSVPEIHRDLKRRGLAL